MISSLKFVGSYYIMQSMGGGSRNVLLVPILFFAAFMAASLEVEERSRASRRASLVREISGGIHEAIHVVPSNKPRIYRQKIVASSKAVSLRVDPSGYGDFQRIQEAINAVPSNNSVPVSILVEPGLYREKIVVPVDKPFITLSGTNAESTIITWSESWDTYQSPAVSILASDFVGRYLSIQNTYGTNGPAVALRVAGDRVAFYSCRFLSYQDTLLDEIGRHYYSNCYIEGATDFIFGNGHSLFKNCHLHSISMNGGAITAQGRTSSSENTGFSFVGCDITGVEGGAALLGRPWGNYSTVVFIYAFMKSVVLPQGWDDWSSPNNQRTVFYGQYHCSGPGSDVYQRVSWSHQFSLDEAKPFLTISMINGQDWLSSDFEKILEKHLP